MTHKAEKYKLGDLVEVKQIGKRDSYFKGRDKLIGSRGKINYIGNHWGGGWRAIGLTLNPGSYFNFAHFFCARVKLIKKGGTK